MKNIKKKVSLVVGGVLSSALLASMMIAPAFAADPTYRSSTGQYTETVAYDSSVETASTEVLIDTKFHYLDYSPEIDVTYSWDEDLEWLYVKKGTYGFWTKGSDAESSWNFAKSHFSGNWDLSSTHLGAAIEGYTDSELNDSKWEDMNNKFYNSPLLCNIIKFENKAMNELYVSVEEQGFSVSATNINGKTYSSTNYSEKEYMTYKEMIPSRYASDTNYTDKGDLFSSAVIGTDTASNENSGGMQGNEYYVGILPKHDFVPKNAWVAENMGGAAIQAQVRVIFTKKEA